MLTPRIIDPASLPRRAHFEYFNSFTNPYVGVTVEADITKLMNWREKKGAPFFLSLLYHVAQAANAVPEFPLKIEAQSFATAEKSAVPSTAVTCA